MSLSKSASAAQPKGARRKKTLAARAASLGVPAAVLCCLAPAANFAQAQVTVLRHVTVIDGNGGAPRHNASLVIDGEKIQAITDASAPVPAGAKVVDLPGKTVMPELVSAHVHLGLLKGTGNAWLNWTEASVERQLLQYQDYGVGAVLCMGTDQPGIWKMRAESHAGKLPGAMIYTAGNGFGLVGGLPPLVAGLEPVYRPATVEDARLDVDQLAPHKPDVVKIWVDDFWGQYIKMKPDMYGAIIDEARKDGLRPVAHVYHLVDAQQLADDGIAAFAHSIRDAVVPDSLAAEMKAKNIAQITTFTVDDFIIAYAGSPAWLNDPYFRDSLEPGEYELLTSAKYKQSVIDDPKTPVERRALPFAMENAMKLYKAGVKVVMGTDSGANSVRVVGFSEHRELQLLVQAGFTPLQAITIGTKNGAEFLHASDQFGTLRPGLLANFIVLDKDPSADIRNTETISQVWARGKKVSNGPHPRTK